MSDVVIKAEGLGKKYVIGHQAENGSYEALRDVLTHNVRSMWHKTKDLFRGDVPVQGDSREDIWALRDIDFEIRQGEVAGIIGRNGSGKSTLLKILSRITEPSQGRVSIRGRVASLLEVGTGFHPELTGRENIFLNGAILGMSRAEITRKFDEIVAFSEVEKFLDTPVKRYSSGMYVRLAFAVAAHLEPEILIVDEVLAVGDIQFQRKCLGKMHDVSTLEGRTVLFVSHNMAALKALCVRGMHLKEGSLRFLGSIDDAIHAYHEHGSAAQLMGGDLTQRRRRGNGKLTFVSIGLSFYDSSDTPTNYLLRGGDMEVSVVLEAREFAAPANVGIEIYDPTHFRLIDANAALKGKTVRIEKGKRATLTFLLRNLYLKPGSSTITLWSGRGGIEDYDWVEEAASFEVRHDLGTIKHTEVFPGPYQCDFEISGCENVNYDEQPSVNVVH